MRTILPFLLLLSLSAKSQSLTTAAPATSWQKHEDSLFSVQHPSSWAVQLPSAHSPFLYFFSERLSADDKFSENVNISHQSIAGAGLTMDTIISATISQVKNLVTNGTVLENKRLERKGATYHKLLYKGDMGVFNLLFLQYYVLTSDHIYVLTFTSEQSQFEHYKATAERILDSFQLKG